MTPDFTARIIFKTSPDAHASWEYHHPGVEPPHFQTDDLPREGPYLLIGEDVYEVFKLYLDPYNAFVCGIVQSNDEESR